MITSLSIGNYALIEKLSVQFSSGFSIITGETGAGKSILLGALGLALGKRADLSALKNKDEKCVIEAEFSLQAYNLQPFFEENDLEYDHHTIIRREILPSGKSRAFVNDTPVNLQELQELGNRLIDIHSQHETRELSEEEFQFRILDSLADNKPDLSSFADLLKQYKKSQAELRQLRDQVQQAMREQDYNNYLFEELSAAALQPGEIEELESQAAMLANVETIRENMNRALSLAESEPGIMSSLREFRSAMSRISTFSEEYRELSERSSALAVELDDMVRELNRSADSLQSDPAALEMAQQRLQLIYSLQKKHGVATIEELIDVRDSLDEKVQSVTDLEEKIITLEQSGLKLSTQLDAMAAQIRARRIKAAPELAKQLSAILSTLGMPDASFEIEISPSDNYFPNGKDAISFLFSANRGTGFGPMKKVASGGELSRIMLAVKSILAQYSKLPTIIFDEIDTGVSGEIAGKMGDIMKQMSGRMQVFAITHLPQIAAKGSDHFRVSKNVSEGVTTSTLSLLTKDERVTEIAQMLSGKSVSESAINHAKALLD